MAKAHCPICGGELLAWRLDRVNVLLRCRDCGHCVRDLDLCPAGARTEAYGGEVTLDRLRLRLTSARVRRMLDPGGRVFEIGYGSGALLAQLHRAGHQVGGVDSGQLGAVRPVGLADTVRVGDASTVRLAPGEPGYDVVLGIHVIEHVASPLTMLSSAWSLLRPGGRIALVTPAADSLGLRWFGATWWMLEDPTHLALFSAASLRRALESAGFVDVRISRPLFESFSCEAASWRRRGRTGVPGGGGVLAQQSTLALVAVTAPLNLLARILRRRLVPAIYVSASRPAAEPRRRVV